MNVKVTALPGQPYRQAITMRNHTIYADLDAAKGGGDTAPNPHELLLGALGACTTMTLQLVAKQRNWDLQGVEVQIDETQVPVAGQATKVPLITKTIQVKGNLSPQELQSMKAIAEKCPVNKLLLGDKQMASTLNVVA